MPQVTVINPTTAKVVDSEGRIIMVKRLNSLGIMKLYGALGPKKSEIDRYVGFAMLAASVVAIGDIPYPPPRSDADIEATTQKLDDHGLEAVAAALNVLADSDKKAEDVADAAQTFSEPNQP